MNEINFNTINYESEQKYHLMLVNESDQANRARTRHRSEKISLFIPLRDRLLLWSGNLLISTGERLRNQVTHVKLVEKCA